MQIERHDVYVLLTPARVQLANLNENQSNKAERDIIIAHNENLKYHNKINIHTMCLTVFVTFEYTQKMK